MGLAEIAFLPIRVPWLGGGASRLRRSRLAARCCPESVRRPPRVCFDERPDNLVGLFAADGPANLRILRHDYTRRVVETLATDRIGEPRNYGVRKWDQSSDCGGCCASRLALQFVEIFHNAHDVAPQRLAAQPRQIAWCTLSQLRRPLLSYVGSCRPWLATAASPHSRDDRRGTLDSWTRPVTKAAGSADSAAISFPAPPRRT